MSITTKKKIYNDVYFKIANHFNNKPVAWSGSIQGLLLGKMRDHAYRRTTAVELEFQDDLGSEKNIERLVIPLGPYRNLTTLLSLLFALHPEAIVLNHAYQRIKLFNNLDFPSTPSLKKVRSFRRAAIKLACCGMAGDYGGTILKSHVFHDNDQIMQCYRENYGYNALKQNAKVLFWKESMRFTNKILSLKKDWRSYDLGQEISFILTIRNPIHCALSNAKTGHSFYLTKKRNQGWRETLRALIELYDQLFFFKSNADLSFFELWEENFINKIALRDLCNFCNIEYSERWSSMVIDLAKIRPRIYSIEHEKEYRKLIDEHFEYDLGLKNKFLRFVG